MKSCKKVNKFFAKRQTCGYNHQMMLDAFDHAILDIVTENNQLTHTQIGQQVNLSASSVRRRLMALRDSGVIEQDVSVLSPDKMGLTFIVHIYTKINGADEDREFRYSLENQPAVSQIYSVSGDMDYIIVVHAQTSQSYEKWAEENLLDNTMINRFTSTLVWSRIKFSNRVKPIA